MSEIRIFDKLPALQHRYQVETSHGTFFMTRDEIVLLSENINVLLDDPMDLPQAEPMIEFMTRPMK